MLSTVILVIIKLTGLSGFQVGATSQITMACLSHIDATLVQKTHIKNGVEGLDHKNMKPTCVSLSCKFGCILTINKTVLAQSLRDRVMTQDVSSADTSSVSGKALPTQTHSPFFNTK